MEKKKGFGRLVRAAGYSMAGYRAAWKNEEAFRQEIVLTVFIIPAGMLLGTTGVQRALLVGVWLVVIMIELINSAIEAVVDRVGTADHELSGRAKDLGSAAVLTSLVAGVMVWGFIAYERFFPGGI